METRTITQVKIYKLNLNRMTSGKIEYSEIAAIGYSKQDVINFCEREKAPEMWHDDRWGKVYKKDSKLEWFNAPNSYEELGSFGHGIIEEWVQIDTLQTFIDNNPDLIIDGQVLQHTK